MPVCVCTATPGYWCAFGRVSMPAPCGHVRVHVCACLRCYGLAQAHGLGSVYLRTCVPDHQRVTSHIQCPWREPPGSARPVGGERAEKRPTFWLRGNPYFGTIILAARAPGPVCILKNGERAVPAVDFCQEASAIAAQWSREGHRAQFREPYALKAAAAEPPKGEPSRGLGRVCGSPSLFDLHPLERPCLVPSVKIGIEFPGPGLRYTQRATSGLTLGPSRISSKSGSRSKGPRLSDAPPSHQPQARSSCRLWAWACASAGPRAPSPAGDQTGRGALGARGVARGGRFSIIKPSL